MHDGPTWSARGPYTVKGGCFITSFALVVLRVTTKRKGSVEEACSYWNNTANQPTARATASIGLLEWLMRVASHADVEQIATFDGAIMHFALAQPARGSARLYGCRSRGRGNGSYMKRTAMRTFVHVLKPC